MIKTAVNQRLYQKHGLKSLVFLTLQTTFVTNQINLWSSTSRSLSWVS